MKDRKVKQLLPVCGYQWERGGQNEKVKKVKEGEYGG
jgi:hypothetical protein